MKSHWFFLFLALIPIGLCNSLCRAEDAELTLNSVLEKWEKASQDCKILDTKLKMFEYDLIFAPNNPPSIKYGRFYYESSTCARYDIGDMPSSETNDWKVIDYSFVWKESETLFIQPEHKQYSKIPIAKMEKAREKIPEKDWGLLEMLLPMFRRQTIFPLLVDVHAEEIRSQYEISFARQDGDIEITAIPKKSNPSSKVYSNIQIFLDSTNYHTKAVRYTLPSNKHILSFVLYEQKINEKPSDRDQLIEPDLLKFRKNYDESLYGAPRGK